jgi:hypothetical protein
MGAAQPEPESDRLAVIPMHAPAEPEQAASPPPAPKARSAPVPVAVSYGWVWPGLGMLWTDGSWRGLAWALSFGLLLDGVLLAKWVWPEVASPELVLIGKFAVTALWIAGIMLNRRWAAARGTNLAADKDLFPAALAEYLQGNWYSAEQKCRDLIRLRRDDVEARLLLATLLRHVGRGDEARTELDLLTKFDGWAAWSWEIARERELLDAPPEEDEDEDESENPSDTVATRRAA